MGNTLNIDGSMKDHKLILEVDDIVDEQIIEKANPILSSGWAGIDLSNGNDFSVVYRYKIINGVSRFISYEIIQSK
jgi:hypothetical protein